MNTYAGGMRIAVPVCLNSDQEEEMKRPEMKKVVLLLALTVGLALMPRSASAQERQPAPDDAPRQIHVTILGMSCPFCVYGVEQKLKKLEGVEDLEVVLETGIATVTMEEGADVSNEELDRRVREAGFEVAKITRSYESEYPEFDAAEKG